MSERATILEWEVLLDDAQWNRTESLDDLLCSESAVSKSLPRSQSHLLPAMAGVILLVVLVMGLHAWRVARAGLVRIDDEVRETVDTETWSQQTGNLTVASSLVDDEADSRWQDHFRRELADNGLLTGAHITPEQAEISNIALRSGLAMVEVIIEEPAGRRHRETRFYRKAHNGGWLRTSPKSVFWGSKQTVETAHFRIHFRQRDAHAIEGTVVRLDSIYANLRKDAGLPPNREKLTVEVKPLTPHQLHYLQFRENRLEVHSPRLLQIPVELSDEEILTESIVHPLVDYVLAEAQQQAAIPREWRHMEKGLKLWQTYVGSGPFAPWYQDTEAWLHSDLMGIQPEHRTVSSEDLQRLCREYHIWRFALPADLSHPSVCTDPHWVLHLPSRVFWPVHLAALLDIEKDLEKWSDSDSISWVDEWVQNVAAATVVDYLVDTYGREQLTALIAGFRTHHTWDTLAPAVWGVSAQELERGWLAHVAPSNRSSGRDE